MRDGARPGEAVADPRGSVFSEPAAATGAVGSGRGTGSGVRPEYSVVADKVAPRRWHQDRELAQQLRGLQHQLGPAVGERTLELIGQPAIGQGSEALQNDRSAGAVGEQASEPFAIVGVQVNARMQGESFDEGRVALARGLLARRLPVRQRGVLGALQEVERVWLWGALQKWATPARHKRTRACAAINSTGEFAASARDVGARR